MRCRSSPVQRVTDEAAQTHGRREGDGDEVASTAR
jgi:hypothetical protein